MCSNSDIIVGYRFRIEPAIGESYLISCVPMVSSDPEQYPSRERRVDAVLEASDNIESAIAWCEKKAASLLEGAYQVNLDWKQIETLEVDSDGKLFREPQNVATLMLPSTKVSWSYS